MITLLDSHQGSGKGVAVTALVSAAANAGKKIVIVEPTTELAQQMKRLLADLNPRILMAHDKYFSGYSSHSCPNYEEIQTDQKNGYPLDEIRELYCNTCPHFSQCEYIHQYELPEDTRILIAQHAHLIAYPFRKLLEKYDPHLLVIDESPVETLIQNIKPSPAAIHAIKEFNAANPQDLHIAALTDWINKKLPRQDIRIGKRRRQKLIKHLEAKDSLELMPEILKLVRLCNDGFKMTESGVVAVYGLPDVAEILITDATANLELLKLATGVNHIEVAGARGIFDPSREHPDNKIYQVLDSTNAKIATRGDSDGDDDFEYGPLIDKVDIIGKLVRKKYRGKKILITTYKDMTDTASKWLQNNYPDISAQVTFNHMESGTNRHENIDVQFILCGVYSNDKQLIEETWKLKSAHNHWAWLYGDWR